MTKGLAKCDSCDYFISVEEAYLQGKEDAIDECIETIKKCHTCEIIMKLEQLKEQNDERNGA